MSLDSMGACFLPYGFERQDDGTWVAFNREYFPLFTCVPAKGFNRRVEELEPQLASVDRRGDVIKTFWLYQGAYPWESEREFASYSALLKRLAVMRVQMRQLPLRWTRPKGYTCLKWEHVDPMTGTPVSLVE